ncbi:MAG: DUF502 domain-containing protein [Candidatus Hydrogenedentes bacterium]|nr:DUF502 domain-containing protein [Candidatus Hydrogenedentota bacterium]
MTNAPRNPEEHAAPARNRGPLRALFGFVHRIWSPIWRTLVAGLLVWIPLIITVWLSWFFISKFVFGVERIIKDLFVFLNERAGDIEALAFLQHVNYPFGLGIVAVTALFLGTGVLTRHIIGRKIIALGEKIVKVVPLVNRVYSAVQQIRDVFIGRKGTVFQKVVLVEYPRPGMTAVAFVTAGEQGVVQEATGQDLVAVFVPTTPNPTSGYLVYLAPNEIQEIDISVEEAMKLIVSGGAYIPGQAERLIRRATSARLDKP